MSRREHLDREGHMRSRTRARRFVAIAVGCLSSMLAPAAGPWAASADELCFGRTPTVAGATTGDDVLTGTPGSDVIVGLDGNDTIKGFGGSDLICGGGGNDALHGGDGADRLAGELGDDVYDGGSGEDTVAFTVATHVFVSLTTGTATFEGADKLVGIEDLTGTPGGDILDGDGHANVLYGGAGGDQLTGFGSASVKDVLLGGTGADNLIAGPGDDRMNGGAGQDWAVFSSSPNGVAAELTAGTATGYGSDTIELIENLAGSHFDDLLAGDANRNVIDGLEGDDTLRGRDGDDNLAGGDGTDTIYGGPGTDNCTYGETVFSCP
jgi:Ca2+-binding RTX toxin-like protein